MTNAEPVDFGLLSLLPSAVAIILAIVSRRVIASLGLAIVVGAGLLAAGLPLAENEASRPVVLRAILKLVVPLYEAVRDTAHAQVLAFTLLFGAMIGVLEASHAMQSLMQRLTRRAAGRRGGQTLVAALGLGVFFDDYANTLLLGGTMRRVCDRLRISRAKLAYLVDSTAAPVAGVAVVSTWVATEVSLIGEGLPADSAVSGFQLFLHSIVYRFYPLFALVLVVLIARTGRDFGPMRTAERRAWLGEANDGDRDGESTVFADTVDASQGGGWLWLAAVLPVLACVLTVAGVLWITGAAVVAGQDDAPAGGLRRWGEVLGNANSYLALIAGSAVGWALAIAATWITRPRRSTARRIAVGSLAGMWQLAPAMVVLWLAWTLSAMTGDEQLNTGGFLGEVLSDRLPAALLPTTVFLVSGLVAFSTGTSWGTMALLTPLAVQLALQLSGAGPLDPLVVTTTGSVLAGSIFGDHCSPISDTTVLSSRACGCDHVEHVRTQMPYALSAAAVAVALGTVPAALGVSPWISLLAGAVVLYGIVRLCGRPVEEATDIAAPEGGERVESNTP